MSTDNSIPTSSTADAPVSESVSESAFRAATSPAFLAAFAVLLVAAISLNAATQYMKLYFKKEPVPLAKQLETVSPNLGPWVQVSVDQTLNPEMLDVLGTKQYIFRQFVDSSIVPPETFAELKDKSDEERGPILGRVMRDHPEAVMRMAVTYYTGMVDTVAHIPDRCYVADGFVPETYTEPTWSVRDQDGQPIDVQVRYINFVDTTPQRNAVPQNVAYFFHCNGGYVPDPIGVRIRLQSLLERHGYYAKVELMNATRDSAQGAKVMERFLQSALPEIEKCLPDWKKLKAGGGAAAPATQPVAMSAPGR
jgi:hypothetical protein